VDPAEAARRLAVEAEEAASAEEEDPAEGAAASVVEEELEGSRAAVEGEATAEEVTTLVLQQKC